ncbi:MAG TPA: MXAN_5187 C-terminal domain-containing protein [bacterium]|nr:MXAN_5187 C-terminal domain-containing protein [bacterium]HPS30728.1 MXAN_5187 C-terminal domain-containing protein [bacterium]
MFSNLGFKLKVFFLMAVVVAALSFFDFSLFKSFLAKIDIRQGSKNSSVLAEEKVKNTTYSLIANSFNIAKQLKFSKASKNSPVKINDISSELEYLVVDSTGKFVAGNLELMSSHAGIPAVERALKEGMASDGTITVSDNIYLIGVVPLITQVPDEGEKLFAVISAKKLTLAFNADELFPMPVKIFSGNKFISETGSESWIKIEKSYGTDKLKSDVEDLVKSESSKVINGWTYLHSFFMPVDMLGGEKIVFVTLTSTLPGWEDYQDLIFFVVIYTLAGIIIAFFFTFIVTHSIDVVFRNLAADISRMKVGEKLVLKKYSHGADIAVSALNILIAKYIRHLESRHDSILPNALGSQSNTGELDTSKQGLAYDAVPDPFGTNDIEETPKKPIKALQPEKNQYAPAYKAPPPSFPDDDEEKTQIVTSSSPSNVEVSSQFEPVDPMEELWKDYYKIKAKNGESVSENEKRSFIGKIKTNRASIIAKYKCADVQFNIEEKDGKPVIKAKPV